MLKRLYFIALFSTALTSFAVAGTNGPIKSVTLSSGGLAEVTRSANVSDGGVVEIEVPLDQVDDVLKSLVINDKVGRVNGISLAGPEPIQETFRSLPFSPDDLKSMPRLLSSLQGTDVEITTSGRSLSGKILGVETRRTANDGEIPVISLVAENGSILSATLSHDTSVTIKNDQVKKKIEDAVNAAGRGKSDGVRTIQIFLSDDGDRPIGLSYVVPAPVWKTSYRIVLNGSDDARLQAWAVLENSTGEDWEGVSIKLASGDPVTLKQSLHQRVWKERGKVEIPTAAKSAPPVDAGLSTLRAMSFAAAPAAVAEKSALQYDMAAPSSSPTVAESDISTSFNLQGLHDLKNGDTMSTPIVDANIKAERVSVFRAHQDSKHPIAAVMLENSTGGSLPKGIITVYDSNEGYVGDAQIENLPAGESRFASFATDLKVGVTSDTRHNQNITSIKVSEGMLRATMKTQNITNYVISGASDDDRTVIVEHPKNSGWTFSADMHEGTTATHHRLKVKVPKGEVVSTTAVEELIRDDVYRIADADTQMLMHWASSTIDDDTSAKLKDLAAARSKLAEAERDAEQLADGLRQAEARQERIRKNLTAVPDQSDAHSRYLGDLQMIDDQIDSLERERGQVLLKINKLSADVDREIGRF